MNTFESQLFIKSTILTIPEFLTPLDITEANLRILYGEITEKEKEAGNLGIKFEDTLSRPFVGKIIPAMPQFSSTIYRVVPELLMFNDYMAEAERTGIKKIYSYGEALLIMKQAMLSGEIKKDAGVSIHFEEDSQIFILRGWRKNRLSLFTRCVAPSMTCAHDGDGECFNG